jgi:hypothetical protein
MTFPAGVAKIRAAAEHAARLGHLTPQQLAALSWLDEHLTPEQQQGFTKLWRAQGSPAAAPSPASSAVVDAVRPLLNVIYAGEGGYDSYNRGRAGDSPGPYPNGGLQRLTVAQVQELQAEGEVFAVGAAQFIPDTLKLAVAGAGLAPSELFNAGNQDRLAAALLLGGKRPSLAAYIKGTSNDLAAAQLDLAKEWASIPGPDGRGFYDGDSAGNRASAQVTSVQLALQKSRALLTGKPAPVFQAQPAPATGLDPRGKEEAGLAGPKKPAPVKPGDSYLLVNDRDQDMEAYDHTGKLLWKIPALARGQGADNVWAKKNTDTPPGLYRIGQIYRDFEQNAKPPQSDTAMSYGWYSFDLVELENQEAANGRAGIMIHGGGTACGWPGAWAPRQTLHPTLGCIRCHNLDLRDRILPLCDTGTVYVGVFQET